MVDFLLAVDSGMLFNERVLQDTYRRLSNVPGVSRVEMPGNMRSPELGEEVLYDVGVNLELNQRIDLTAEAQMIRSDARYGPIGSIGFRNNNVRGKADVLECALTGGIISTRPFSYTEDAFGAKQWHVVHCGHVFDAGHSAAVLRSLAAFKRGPHGVHLELGT